MKRAAVHDTGRIGLGSNVGFQHEFQTLRRRNLYLRRRKRNSECLYWLGRLGKGCTMEVGSIVSDFPWSRNRGDKPGEPKQASVHRVLPFLAVDCGGLLWTKLGWAHCTFPAPSPAPSPPVGLVRQGLPTGGLVRQDTSAPHGVTVAPPHSELRKWI